MNPTERHLKDLKEKCRGLYGPKTAFGNKELIAIVAEIEKLNEFIETTIECLECNGTGEIDHDCDCPLCYHDKEECRRCDATGRISVATLTTAKS